MSTIPEKVAQFSADVDVAHAIIHGPASGAQSIVETDGGPVPTLARAMSEGVAGPANTLVIGTVTTGAAGSAATADIAGNPPNQTLNLTIPRGDTGNAGAAAPKVIQAACSDLSTALTAGTGKAIFRLPYSMTLTEVRASLSTASTSGSVSVAITVNGAAVLSTNITIDQGEKTSLSATIPAVIAQSALQDDAEVSIDVLAAGVGAGGLVVTLIGF